jgi:hypothetical protein
VSTQKNGDKIITVDPPPPQLKFPAKKDLLQPRLIGGRGGGAGRGGVEDVWLDVGLGFSKLFIKNDSETPTPMISCKGCITVFVLRNMHVSRRTFKVIRGDNMMRVCRASERESTYLLR